MNKHVPTASCSYAERENSVLRLVMLLSWLLLAAMAVCSCWVFDWQFAQSLLLGGILVNGSFWLLQKDAQRLMQRLSLAEVGMAQQTEKTRFFLRSFARLVVLGLLLFVVAVRVPINVIGLTLGFTTVMVSVVIIGLSASKCWLPSKA
ncbi:MAG: ATP synthase subunit I [Desulfobulbus sp.]|nr:ATP synthase subunit I [Desulfobulbus sp.]